jgi:hypothetical protein
MKRLILLMILGLALCAVNGFVGCSDDDDNDVVGPTAADSAEVEMFMSEFGEFDQSNGQMFNAMMYFIDSIMKAGGAGKVSAAAEVHITLEWRPLDQHWLCTAVDTSDSGEEVFYYVNAIQFLHGNDTVQWPADTLLTEVRSDMRLTVTSEDIDTAYGTQNLVLTVETPGSDTVTANGTGSLVADISEMDIEGSDTTICDISVDLGYAYTDLMLDLTTSSGGEVDCPFSGTMAATGSVDVTCTGAWEGSVGGNWTVTQEFDNGEVTIIIQHGGFTYRTIQYCY